MTRRPARVSLTPVVIDGQLKRPEIRAGIYCRISVAAIGDMTKTDDQERICRELAARIEWPVVDVYVDHSKSAWQPNRKRKDWDRMLVDVESGHINAIIAFHGDRLIGRPEDLAMLLSLGRTRGTLLASPSGDRDLSNPDDEFVMWIEAAMKGRESANLSPRRKAQYERWRLEGRVRHGGRGGRAFGFATDGVTHNRAEAKIVRETARRILAGESTAAVARDLAGRGIKSPAGNAMTNGTLTRLLSRPRYAGLMPDGLSRASWRGVLDRETWELLQAELTIRSARVRAPSNRARYLLSGIAEDPAGHALQISGGHSGPPFHKGYRCYHGCRVSRDQPLLDAYVIGRVTALLARRSVTEAPLPDTPGLAGELLTLTERRAEAEAVIASYADRPERLAVLARALDSIDERIAAVREQIGASALRVLGQHAGMTAAGFLALPLDVQRALVRASYRVIVKPASKRGPGFRTEDVEIIPLD